MPLFPARDGATLRVRLLGRGQPVLMLHGLGMQGRDWLPFVFNLEVKCCCSMYNGSYHVCLNWECAPVSWEQGEMFPIRQAIIEEIRVVLDVHCECSGIVGLGPQIACWTDCCVDDFEAFM